MLFAQAQSTFHTLVVREKTLPPAPVRRPGTEVAITPETAARRLFRQSGPARTPVVKPPTESKQNLAVTAPAHAVVRVSGVGRFFPATRVDVRNTGVVAIGHNCRLSTVDHYHVRRVSLSLSSLLRPSARLRRALQALLRHPANSFAIREFQRALTPRRATRHPRLRNQAVQAVAAGAHVEVDTAQLVQIGGGSTANVAKHFIVHESVIRLEHQLRRDPHLVTLLAVALREPTPGSVAALGRRALRTAGQAPQIEQLAEMTLDAVSDASVASVFSGTTVRNASTTVLGRGSRVDQRAKLDVPVVRPRDLLTALEDVRQRHGIDVTALP